MSEEGRVIEGEATRVAESTQAQDLAPVPVYETAIVAFGPTAMILGALEKEYKGRIYDVTTKEGDAAAREARRKLVAARTGLEDIRKTEKAEILERGRLIDSEAKRITAVLKALEDPIDAQIKAEEARKAAEKAERERIERERVEGIRAKINGIKAIAFENVGQPSAIIQLAIDVVNDMAITKDEYQEFAVEADTVRSETLAALYRMFGAAEVLEKQQAELKAQQEALQRQALETADREKSVAQREQALNVQGKQEPASTPPPPAPDTPKEDKPLYMNCSVGITVTKYLHDDMPWSFDGGSGEMRDATGKLIFVCRENIGYFLSDLSRTIHKQAR